MEHLALSYLAFTLMVEDAKRKDTNPVAWACASDECKKEWTDRARASIKETLALGGNFLAATMTDQGLSNTLMDIPQIKDAIKNWQDHEALLARERASGNPTAFFVHVSN